MCIRDRDNDNFNIIYKVKKCPEVRVTLNGVPTCALLDSGSQVNAVSEQWFKDNKKELGDLAMLRMSNTVIKGATGSKSKRVTQQILLTVQIEGLRVDSVFVVVPELIKDCILGIGLLEENG